MGADENGKLVAMEGDWSVDHGPYSEFGDLVTLRGAQYMGAGYNIPNIRSTGRTVCTNHGWGAPYRSYGSPQAFLASESVIDDLAEKMGIDPFEFRYMNVYRPGDTTPTGQTPDVFAFPELFDKLRPIYQEAKAKAARESTSAIKKGVGVSLGIYGSGLDGIDGAEADVELTKNGVTVYNCWQDHGQGADCGTVGTAHQALLPLGIDASQISLVLNDTALAPNGGPSGGSRCQVMIGQAIKDGCEKLLAAMRKPDGTFRSYDEMVAAGIDLKYRGAYTTTNTGCNENAQGDPFTIYMYALFVAEVAVEIATGKVKVEGYTLGSDIGSINSRLSVDGQMYGGIAQGIGLALSEDFEDLEKHVNMLACGIPYANDVPDKMDLIYVETPRPLGPFGAAGVGEAPLTASHVAVINGIKNATGVRITHLPALPEKVLAALEAKGVRA
jgi:aldehyde oxidoreductase